MTGFVDGVEENANAIDFLHGGDDDYEQDCVIENEICKSSSIINNLYNTISKEYNLERLSDDSLLLLDELLWWRFRRLRSLRSMKSSQASRAASAEVEAPATGGGGWAKDCWKGATTPKPGGGGCCEEDDTDTPGGAGKLLKLFEHEKLNTNLAKISHTSAPLRRTSSCRPTDTTSG